MSASASGGGSGVTEIRLDRGRAYPSGADGAAFHSGLAGIKILGLYRGRYYFQGGDPSEIRGWLPKELCLENLCDLCELAWWQDRFPFAKDAPARGPFDIAWARDELMKACRRVGLFRPDRVRGVGAWYSPALGYALLHDGSWVHEPGEASHLPADAPGEFVFQAEPPIDGLLGYELLEEGDGELLAEALGRFSWARAIDAELLAGFLVLAPFCGALPWRPHMWITGGSQAGKSTLLSAVVYECLGRSAIRATMGSTEAGLRQYLGNAARPIVHDEAELGHDPGRREALLAFARAQSSDDLPVLKGSAGHKVELFRGVSSLLFVSVDVGLDRLSDVARWVVVELLRGESGRRPPEPLPAGFGDRLRATTWRHFPAVLDWARAFQPRIGKALGSDRLGWQYGLLLAGARLLRTCEPLGPGEADDQARRVREVLGDDAVSEARDERRCLAQLCAARLELTDDSGRRSWTQVGEAIAAAIQLLPELPDVLPLQVEGARAPMWRRGKEPPEWRALCAHGVRVHREWRELPGRGLLLVEAVLVATSHPCLAAVFDGTEWGGGWWRALGRLSGAAPWGKAVRFGPGVVGKAVAVPFAELADGEECNR